MSKKSTQSFIEERLRAMQPDIDLTVGSPAYDQVVDPTVRRYEPDPFDVDIDTFLTTILSQNFPDMNIREGSGIRDLLHKPISVLMEPIQREVKILRQNQSLAHPELLSVEDADSLVANLFVARPVAGLAHGVVRMYFNAPVALTLSVGNTFYTGDGIKFIPTTMQSITAESMVFNQSGNLYYFDVNVTAEKAGIEYNVGREKVIGVSNMNVAVRVTNLSSFSGGSSEQTTEDLVERAEKNITERSLVVSRGVSARLFDSFTDLKHLQVTGFMDPEMKRDILIGGDRGDILASGNDGYTEDDGDGDAWSYRFRAMSGTDFVNDVFGVVGAVTGYWLSLSGVSRRSDASVPAPNLDYIHIDSYTFDASFVGSVVHLYGASNSINNGTWKVLSVITPHDVKIDRSTPGIAETGVGWMILGESVDTEILEVISGTEVAVKTAIPADMNSVSWSVRKKELRISRMPGGAPFFNSYTESIPSGEIHIGGCSDFYVSGDGVVEDAVAFESVTDEEPLVSGEGMETSSVDTEFLKDASTDFVALGVKPGMSVVLRTGVDAGVKSILRVGVSPPIGAPNVHYIQVDPPLTSTATGIDYNIVDELDINLTSPRTMRGTGTDLQTLQMSDEVTTSSALDFDAMGAAVGDVLRILSGPDTGDFTVSAISGVGNRILKLNGPMTYTSSSIAWELFKLGDGLEVPLVRVSSVELLDGSKNPTGDIIPYASPVDVRSSAFSNSNHGIKLQDSNCVIGIVGTLDLVGIFPVVATLSITVDGVTKSVSLNSAVSPESVVSIINSYHARIADLMTVDGETRLVLRSSDRHISVSVSSDNAVVGLDVGGEDNRRVRCNEDTSALTDYKDSVILSSSGASGLWYLLSADTSTSILVFGVDEETGTIRFPTPSVRASVVAGSRSYGKARVYFKDPTSFQVRGGWRPPLKSSITHPANEAAGGIIPEDEGDITYFEASVNGTSLRFFPDPDMSYAFVPEVGADAPNNLSTVVGNTLVESDSAPSGNLGKGSRSSPIDFLKREVRVGDLLNITYCPIQTDIDLESFTYPNSLKDETLIVSLNGSPAKTCVFSDQLTSATDVISEINTALGSVVAYKETIGAISYVRFEGDYDILIHKTGTANAILWSTFGSNNKDNTAPAHVSGGYVVWGVTDPTDPTSHSKLTIKSSSGGTAPAATEQSQHFTLHKRGVQRIHTTSMAKNEEHGLYYVDVELVSDGPGDDWNIGDSLHMDVVGYESDGYRMTSEDDDLTFSEYEKPWVHVTRTILLNGQSDRPDKATSISLQNVQVSYDRSSLVSYVQAFSNSELERVLNANIVVRHLLPHYINLDLVYSRGSDDSVVQKDVLDHIVSLGPDDRVEVSDIEALAMSRGATYVKNPLVLIAVVHNEDRSITVDRSEDAVSTGRLSTFLEGEINVTREKSSIL